LLLDPEAAAGLQADLQALAEQQVPFDVTASLGLFEARLERGDLGDPDLDQPLEDDAAAEGGPEDAGELDLGEPLDADAIEPSGMVAKPPHAPVTGGVEGGSAGQALGQGVAQGTTQLTAGKLLAVLALSAGVGWGALRLSGSEPVAPSAMPAVPSLAQAPQEQATPEIGTAESAQAAPTTEAAPFEQPDPSEPAHARQRPTALRAPGAPRDDVRDAAPRDGTPRDATPGADAPSPPEAPVATPAPPIAPSPPVEADDSLQRELAQLGEVRRALTTDPKRALQLANRGHQEFGEGALFQEREALALRALSALGDEEGLESRGRAFLLRFPKSSFAREVERMLRK
jgi:hypothetical protein